MTSTRALAETDHAALQVAIDRDTFHPGTWTIQDFIHDPSSEDEREKVPKVCTVIEDSKGPITYVRFTKTLRICCVWADGTDNQRNARAIIFGVRDAVQVARANGFTEIIIQTDHDKLATFLTDVMKMTKCGNEYLLAV
jgi:hypothetical protein